LLVARADRGGRVLVAISSLLIRMFRPRKWRDEAFEKVKREAPEEDEDFDSCRRITSRAGGYLVGHQFVMGLLGDSRPNSSSSADQRDSF